MHDHAVQPEWHRLRVTSLRAGLLLKMGGSPSSPLTLQQRSGPAEALSVAASRAREETRPFPTTGVTAIGCSCNHLSDFVAVKVPTSLREKLDLALINVPRSRSGATARPNFRPVP